MIELALLGSMGWALAEAGLQGAAVDVGRRQLVRRLEQVGPDELLRNHHLQRLSGDAVRLVILRAHNLLPPVRKQDQRRLKHLMEALTTQWPALVEAEIAVERAPRPLRDDARTPASGAPTVTEKGALPGTVIETGAPFELLSERGLSRLIAGLPESPWSDDANAPPRVRAEDWERLLGGLGPWSEISPEVRREVLGDLERLVPFAVRELLKNDGRGGKDGLAYAGFHLIFMEETRKSLAEFEKVLNPAALAHLSERSQRLLEELGKSRDVEQERVAALAYLVEALNKSAAGIDASADRVAASATRVESGADRLADIVDRVARTFPGTAEDPARCPVILWDPVAESLANRGDVDSLIYRNARDEYRGRSGSLEAVLNDLLQVTRHPSRDTRLTVAEDADPFRYTVVHAPAGTGKSRFAMRVLEEAAEAYPLRGFVERRGERIEQTLILDPKQFDGWSPKGPTLIVIDYCSRYPNLVAFLRGLRHVAKRSSPIRVLLLERYFEGEFAEALAGHGEEWLRELRLPGEVALQDDPLQADDLETIIRGRLGTAGEQLTTGELMERLSALDPERRPLFAAMLGEALADEMSGPPGAAAPTALAGIAQRSSADERLRLFRWYLSREKSKWFEDHDVQDKDRIARERHRKAHLNLLALSTLCHGLTAQQFKRAAGDSAPLLPSVGSAGDVVPLDKQVLQRMTGRFPDRTSIGFLEPDLLGELFVLDRLELLGEEFFEEDHVRLVDTAWAIAPGEVGAFVRQCFQDYPALVEQRGFLRPGRDDLMNEWVPTARTLLHDCRALCTLPSITGPLLEAWVGHARELLGMVEHVFRKDRLEEHEDQLQHLAAAIRYALELVGAESSEEIRRAIRYGHATPANQFREMPLRRGWLSIAQKRAAAGG